MPKSTGRWEAGETARLISEYANGNTSARLLAELFPGRSEQSIQCKLTALKKQKIIGKSTLTSPYSNIKIKREREDDDVNNSISSLFDWEAKEQKKFKVENRDFDDLDNYNEISKIQIKPTMEKEIQNFSKEIDLPKLYEVYESDQSRSALLIVYQIPGILKWKARVDKNGFTLIWEKCLAGTPDIINNFLLKRKDPHPMLAATTLHNFRDTSGEIFVPTMHKLHKNSTEVKDNGNVKLYLVKFKEEEAEVIL
jgi:hypothetical protein